MFKFKTLLIGLVWGLSAVGAVSPALAQAPDETRWVADDLSAYVRSGPTDGYRIVGRLTSGAPVTVLETQGDYTRVRAESGDEVWIRSDQLQSDRSLRQRVPALKEKVATLSDKLDGINQTWQSRTASMTETLKAREQRIEDLSQRNTTLDQKLTQTEATLRRLKARLDTQEQDLLMRYFLYGGGVAGAGLVAGLLVPHLPRRRKKRDRWF
ncbi:TIGR04211 family SH3 domain-containing protein [Modicisalibacter tunisiensis]|uniref:SH3 domain-containing protein n=1 Tax=Modicisalibacter tunisiensis TaxID=390637 RepID=A0ABS7X470_9GAMM|nr:TIGR04211 family SH3 domain-containing protein [Modicisalibacter tunisiensis]KXS39511.1 MAG: SH3 domain protein [Halomonadaceae bacterium T82-2]MBZ9568736.1 SH3 domain-containing protein [Modicisalibacter tunisiensis]